MKKYVVDTNIILQGLSVLKKLAKDNEIIITETILNEVDDFKIGNGEINYNARAFNRLLADSKIISNENDLYVETEIGKIRILQDAIKHSKADDTIIETIIQKFYPEEIIFISNDITFRTKCFLKGYKAEPFFDDKENIDVNFFEKYETNEHLPNKEYLKSEEFEKYGIIIPDHISYFEIHDSQRPYFFIREDLTTFKRIEDDSKRYFGIKPKNLEQKVALELMLGNNDIVTMIGLAGSGKTLLALIAALELKKQGKIDRIQYIRRTIISGDKMDEIGFLPGSLNKKMQGYIYPLRDNIEVLIKNKNRKKKNWSKNELEEEIKKFENDNNIEYLYEGHLRGRNLSGCIIIDEAQNDSISSLRTILSRVMDGSKVFILGSIEQIDNPYLNKYDNALSFMMGQCGTFNGVKIQGIKFKKSIRGRIVEWIENIL